jgi:acyl carrier protein
MSDGRIDFLGRMDFQVKIRGYRIELGEIETQLGRLRGVRQAVVIAREDNPGDKRLVAYITADGNAPDADALRDGLRASLPEFMVPSAFAFLDNLPLTPNGKVDRKALPAAETLRAKVGGQGPAPEGDLERTIAEIWKRVLGVAVVGREENFFDLGGHSLLVVQAHRALREKLDRPLSLTDLYRFPTVGGLAGYLGGTGGDEGAKKAKDRAAKRRELMRRRRH